MIDTELLALLACPACQGSVELEKDEKASFLICVSCARKYPIVDDIPVLLVD